MEETGELFQYTSGRWIYNESLRLKERNLAFNVLPLKHIAAKSVGSTGADVVAIKKLAEGGFNRAFEITMRDGYQVVARLPYPTTLPKHYTIASEVATMDFLRAHRLPVPKVFDYSTTNENPVGAEYMIMEKVTGKQLGDVWFIMSEEERLKMVLQAVRMETKLFSIRLPASGSIYYKHDLAAGTKSIDLPVAGGAGSFCIGPDAHYTWWSNERSSLSIERKPYQIPEEVMQAVANRELLWMRQFARPRFPLEPLYRDIYDYCKVSPAEHISNLSNYLRIIEHLVPKAECFLSRPTLRHPDLQPNNIFVSDSLSIVGLIDWQHCSILPLFLQAGPPKYFQNYGDEESERLVKPQLPENIQQMSEEEQAVLKDLHRRRQLHYYYFTATAKLNKDHFEACAYEHGVLRQRLFQHAGQPWEGDNVTLKADIIRAIQHWRDLPVSKDGNIPRCPLSYPDAEVEECLKLDAEQREADEDMKKSCSCLGVTTDGWVPTEGYDHAKKLSEKFKAEAIELAESDFVRAQIQRYWPFDDHDEDE